MSRAKKLRKYVPFTKANPRPEPELIDMSVWRIGGPRGFRTDLSTRNSEDSEHTNTDEIVDRDWVLVSRDGLIVPDDWDRVSNEDSQARSLALASDDREDEDFASDGSSADSSSSESDDVPCVVPNFAARYHPEPEPNPFLLQQLREAQEGCGRRQRLGGGQHEVQGTRDLEDSHICRQWAFANLNGCVDDEEVSARGS